MSASWLDPQAIGSVCRGAALLAAPTRDCPRSEEAPSTQASLSASCTPHDASPPALTVDPKVQARDFWASLHGQVPGLLDWDMGNECFLSFITTQLSEAEQNREWGSRGGRVGGRGIEWADCLWLSRLATSLGSGSRTPRRSGCGPYRN